MSKLTDLRQVVRNNLTEETLAAYTKQVIAEWQEASRNGWYHTKTMREADLIECHHLKEQLTAEEQSKLNEPIICPGLLEHDYYA